MVRICSVLFLLIACISCETNSAQSNSTLDVTTFREQMNTLQDIQIVDVRTPEEFAGGHLAKAININYNSGNFEQQLSQLSKSKTTFVYCLSGGRSSSAMTAMTKNGFAKVLNMKGGILAWKANNFPLEAAGSTSGEWIGMSRDEFDKLCQSEVPILFDFKAKWCGPCKQLLPILMEIEKEYQGSIIVKPIDIDENKSLADALKIRSIPFLMYYKNGKLAMNIEGLTDKENLVKSFGLKK